MLMGYAAHRAWITGLNALDPNVYSVAKVCYVKYNFYISHIVPAKRDNIYGTIGFEPRLSTHFFRVKATNTGNC